MDQTRSKIRSSAARAIATFVLVTSLQSMVKDAHAVPVDSMSITSVSFQDNHPIYHDTGQQGPYSGIHWLRGRSSQDQSPVCYTRDTIASVQAIFTVAPTNSAAKVRIRGLAGDHILQTKEVTPQDGLATYNGSATPALPKAIRPGDSFSIRWQYSKDNGASWADAGTSVSDAYSSNQMYVTLADPTASKLFHTVVNIGCNSNAGQTVPDTIVSNIWAEFSDLSVARVATHGALKYYGAGGSTGLYFDTADLLKHGDGRCGAWMRLHVDTIRAHDISVSEVAITPKDVPAMGYVGVGIVVKSNLNGQGSTTPVNRFVDHAVTKYGTSIVYDPSYGKAYQQVSYNASKQKWEDDSLDAIIYKQWSPALGWIQWDEPDTKGSMETQFSS